MNVKPGSAPIARWNAERAGISIDSAREECLTAVSPRGFTGLGQGTKFLPGADALGVETRVRHCARNGQEGRCVAAGGRAPGASRAKAIMGHEERMCAITSADNEVAQ